MKRVGSDISAQDRWRTVGASYAKGMAGPYHGHRIAVIKALLPDLTGKRLVDFGCGEGVMIREAMAMGARDVVGIDPDATLLGEAKSSGADRLVQGSVAELAKLDRADCLLAANVAAYFTDSEDETFYQEARRLLPAGGALVVTHSNELFDLFTLNAFTAAFHEHHFANDVRSLLTNPEVPRRLTFNVRENPLSYPDRAHGIHQFSSGAAPADDNRLRRH
jgi:2-polyprenyl-3-methyl-5-hydroxy-6-metoxy-1,4-benzoquinol methylase